MEGFCHLDILPTSLLIMARFIALKLYEAKRQTGIKMPQRNKFIAKHIFEQTGEKRSCKQVAGRLAALKAATDDSECLSSVLLIHPDLDAMAIIALNSVQAD